MYKLTFFAPNQRWLYAILKYCGIWTVKKVMWYSQGNCFYYIHPKMEHLIPWKLIWLDVSF